MRNKTKSVRRIRSLVSVAFAGVILMVGAGCNCININLGGPQAYSPGGGQSGSPPPSGGNFVPVQSVLANHPANSTVCGQTVSDKLVRFYPPSQIPNPGENGFRGQLVNVSTGQVIPNNTYVLQWIVTLLNKGCATPVPNSTTEVFFPATPGLSYKIAAHFKPGQVPPGNPTIRLDGAWVIQ